MILLWIRGATAKTVNFNLKPFTLVGATTRSGLLASPLRDRFGIYHHLEFYDSDDLAEIVTNSAVKLDIPIDVESAYLIAERSRGTPRIANRLLRRVRDYTQVKSQDGKIIKNVAMEAFRTLKVDGLGLDESDRRIMKVMHDHYQGGPVGVEALAATLNEEVDTLVDVVEPYLLKIGFIKRTQRGRVLSDSARKHLLS